ncbi:hypothetical protein [uncultured Methanobrevibacter sp.]|uniref:hypothetical protein n=1 Tax=uncultured Methanobrevibacter sp. TaxID=253161 RepID=UPI0025DE985C|nr:hypothetical protein [uncultured Methanobrevibacter sp.]
MKIDLHNLPSKRKIDIIKDIFSSDEGINLEKYGLSVEEIDMIMDDVLNIRPVYYNWNIKGNTFANYFEYNIFGGKEAHS